LLSIIQARTSSKRFKNKVLIKIYGKSLINHVYDKTRKSKKLKKIIVATSIKKSDDKLVDHLKKLGIPYFRGDLQNVAKRFLDLAIKKKARYFLRISGDSPLINYKFIDKAIDIQKKTKMKYDLITNIFPRTFPKGQSIEIIKTSTLKRHINNFSKKEKEHVTKFFYNNSTKIKIKNFKSNIKKKLFNQTIDTRKDLIFMKKKFKKELKTNL
jgi:spore coat polysaccharide biosynthesis protein SpsF (cytidylyltransferase family)